MMKRLHLAVAGLSVAAVMMLAPNGYAQNQAPLFNAAGSTGAFNAVALAARISNPGGASGVCGDHNWTKKSTAQGLDSRSGSISAVTANVWIVWDDTPEPNRKVCSYLSVDSIVGTRLFFAVPTGTLSIPSTAINESGDNIVPLLPPDEALPTNIYNDLNGQPFNVAPSDIRPEDAKFGTTRALSPLTSNRSGLGYGPGPIGATILSAFSTKSAQVVDFNISGTDPITGMTVPKYITTNVGAQAIMIVANSTNTAAGHLGNSQFSNLNRFVLAGIQDGTFTDTRDIVPASGLPDVPLTVFNREPLSGTFNTEEFTIPRSVEINTSQEMGVDPSQTGGNPLNLTAADGSKRQRVIGTGEMITELNATPDSLGYLFWSFGNTATLATTGKYLTVDGVDPIQSTYTNGTFPTCPTPPCAGLVTFPHILDGTYPSWNVLRMTTHFPVPAGVTSLIAAAQIQVANIPDFVPVSQLQVFRSHYLQSGVGPRNGHIARSVEQGGDMGGAVYTVQADLDNITDTGKELINKKQ